MVEYGVRWVHARVKWLGYMLDLLILKNLHSGFHNSYANFYSHQQRITVPIHTSSPTVLVRPIDDSHSDGGVHISLITRGVKHLETLALVFLSLGIVCSSH